VATETRNNVEESRYELVLDGDVVGVADYRVTGDTVVFPHTEIRAALRGRGYGEQLVRAALDDVRGDGRTVVPTCWFVAQFIEDNPEYRDLVAA
jgi:predicted GNAT family acetyltransferase